MKCLGDVRSMCTKTYGTTMVTFNDPTLFPDPLFLNCVIFGYGDQTNAQMAFVQNQGGKNTFYFGAGMCSLAP